MTKLISAKYACWFCHEEITIEEYAAQTPEWISEGPWATSGPLHLVHKECVKPAQVAARLLKGST